MALSYQMCNSAKTGGAWNETKEKVSVPVFEFGADGKISQIGENIVNQTSYHGAGGGSVKVEGSQFLDYRAMQKKIGRDNR